MPLKRGEEKSELFQPVDKEDKTPGSEPDPDEDGDEGDDDDDSTYTYTPPTSTGTAKPPFLNPHATALTGPSATTTPPPTTPQISLETLVILKTFDDSDAILSFSDTTTSWGHTRPLPFAHTTIHRENLAEPSSIPSASESFGSVTKMSEEAGTATGSPSQTSPSSASSSSSTTSTDQPADQHSSSHPPYGAIIVVPIVVIILLIIAFFLWRRKRKARIVAAATVQEMRMRDQEEALPEYSAPARGANVAMPYIVASSAGGTTAAGTASSSSPNSASPTGSRHHPGSGQPVILSNTIQSAYMTGLDTSDNMSTTSSSNNHTQTGSTGITTPGNRLSYDARSMISSDEPPPPYRPASVPPISRETSLRHPNVMNHNISQVLAPLSEATRSSYDGTDDFRVADGLRNPFSGGSISGSSTAPIAEEDNESINDPFADGASVMTRSSGNSSAPVSPLEEGRHPGFDARLSTCCVSRPESMVA